MMVMIARSVIEEGTEIFLIDLTVHALNSLEFSKLVRDTTKSRQEKWSR